MPSAINRVDIFLKMSSLLMTYYRIDGFMRGCSHLLNGSIPSNGFAYAPGPEASQKEQYHSVRHRVLYDSSDAKTHNASPVVIEMGKCAGRRQSGSFLAHL